MIEADQIEQLVPVSHPDVRLVLGIDHLKDSDQVARRMARDGLVPHVRIGRRYRFSLPALKKWAAEKINNSVAAQTAQDPAEASAEAK